MKRFSIGLRLSLSYLAIFALAELAFGAGMWLILRHNLYAMVDDDLDGQSDDLKSFFEAQKKNASVAKLREEVEESYGIEHSGDYLEIYLETGDLIYRSPFLQAHPSALVSANQINRTMWKSRRIDGHAYRFLLQQLEANGHTYAVEMGVPADDAVQTLTEFRNYLLIFAPFLLIAAGGVGFWLSRRALAPVDALVRTARDVSGANLSSRLQKLETGDELQRLSDTLNEMLDRIESAFLRITQFTADASHELRTPISLIRTEAELALRRSRGEAEYKESLRHILLEAERTTALVEQLLSIARADSGRETLNLHPVDLAQTLRGIVAGWQQVATIRNLEFSAQVGGADSFVLGDESMLRRLIDILLDNAFKYTSSPGSVRLWLEHQAEGLVIAVGDSGIGISDEDQGKIFERFFRVDKARNRALGGAGLGLAIARWIVTQHRGTITVESRLGEGAIFRVALPMIAAPVRSPLPV